MDCEIIFPQNYFEEREAITPAKGWLEVKVRRSSGEVYALSFYDPVRLTQTLEDYRQQGQVHVTEPGLVVLTEVTTENVRRAVADLVNEGFFRTLAAES